MSKDKPKADWKKAPKVNDQITEQAKQLVPQEVERPQYEYDKNSEDTDKQHRRKSQGLDPLTVALDANGYEINRRFPWLYFDFGGRRYPLSVDRFYPDHLLAVDINKPDQEAEQIKIKREFCHTNGIKYYHCKNSDEMNAMVAECLDAKAGVN